MGRGTDALKYGAGGAAAGAPFGPWGAAIGGGLGGLYGLFGGGSSDEGEDLQRTYQEISNRYEQYRPEDMARRKLALQQAMQLFQPSRDMASAMAGGAPMPDWQSFFQPGGGAPGGGQLPPRPPMPRSDPAMNFRGTPSGDPGMGPPPGPQDPWRGRPV